MTPIAITGMACLFPGADGVGAYWRNILAGEDAVSDPPPEAWDPDVYYDPDFTDEDATYTKRGGYLGSLASFDALEHGIPPMSVGGEPDQWLALKVARDALADAGALDLPDAVRQRTTIVLGKGTYLNGGNAIAVQRGLVIGQTLDLLRRLHPEHTEADLEELRAEMQRVLPALDADTVPGLIPNIIVGRIANRLDLMGPAYTVDAACASSLVAIGHAVRDLRSGAADLAIAGGSQVWMPVATMNLFCRLGALSRREHLRPFDKQADGTLLGEGIGMVVLKRLADAQRDGDRVYALIRGVGIASDGRGASVMAPRVDGEELALRRAYEDAGVTPAGVGLIEAHGTGTPVGDAAEIAALTRVFGERDGDVPRVALGSVKSMISHTIPAAGVAAVIKTALALHHRVLPPTLCDEPSADIGLERSPFYLNTQTRPWIHGGAEPRRAGVNAFGFGGINAHAVLEEHAGAVPAAAHRPAPDTELVVLEAADAAGLADAADVVASAVARHPEHALADIAVTLSRRIGRVAAPVRLGIVASSAEDLCAKLAQAAGKLRDPKTSRIRMVSGVYYAAEPLAREGKVAVVFPGEGAQYPGMLADLCLQFDEVREVFDRVDRLYAGHPRGDLLSDWVFPRPAFSDAERTAAEARLMELDIAVESVLTANGALYALLERLLGPVDAVVGHSSGEHSAAFVAGVLDTATDDGLVAFSQGLYRAYAGATARHDIPGAVLLALGIDRETALEVAAEAGGELHLAMDNCPHQAVIVGEPAAIARARDIAAARNLVGEVLPYDRAVHTPMFAPFAEDLRAVFADLPLGRATLPLWSCTTAARYPDDEAAVRELLVEHWTSPVRFRETIEALHDDGVRVFVECGPRGNMTAFVDDILRGRPSCAVALDSPRRSGMTQLHHAVAQLAVHDAGVDLAHLYAQRPVVEVDLDGPAAPASNGHGRVALNTSWPMLRLDDAFVERFRGRGGPPAAPAPAAAAPAARAAEPAPPQPMPDDAVASVIDGHLRTMEQFLATTQDVVLASLASVLDGPRVTEHRVDPAADAFLRDHAFGRDISRTDPELRGMVVMPLAMSIALLADAALAAAGGGVVTGLREVRAHRWLAFGEAPETLTLRTTPLADGAFAVALHQDPAAAPCVEGTVLVADAYPAPPPPLRADLRDARPSRWPPERLYDEAMFHGPSWQAVEAIDTVAPAGATARLRVRDTGTTPFAVDPVVLDAAGQVVGFWTAEMFDTARIVFPFRAAAIDIFGPRRSAGELLGCTAAIARIGEERVSADIDVTDAQGRPWMRLTGWEDRRFEVPDMLAPLTAPSGMAPLSADRATGLDAPWDVACRGIDARLPADGGLWGPTWARRVLSRAERPAFDALDRPSQTRRMEWLGARTAAKEALASLTGGGLMPADVEISGGDGHRPEARVPGLPAGTVPAISLAHARGRTAALAALVPAGSGAGVGIDLEPLRELPDGFATAALRPGEQTLLPDAGDEWLLRCWCAKEAAGKAVGTGVGQRDEAPVIVAIEPDSGTVTVAVAAHGARLRVATRREDDLILAAAAWPGPDGGAAA